MSFVDLVSDPAERMRGRLRLRIASRQQKPPLVEDPDHPAQLILRKPELDKNDEPLEHSEEDFHPTQVHLWPPNSAPIEVYDILLPSGRVRNVGAIAGDRSIIYMTDPSAGTPDRKGASVMISFDPSWKYPGLKKLDIFRSSDIALCNPKDLPSPSKLGLKRAPSSLGLDLSSPFSIQEAKNKRSKCEGGGSQERMRCWQDGAMYLSINQGYWFR
jgi:hypothetical protein